MGERDSEAVVLAEGSRNEEFGPAESIGTDGRAEAGDGAVAREDAAGIDDAAGAALAVKSAAGALDDIDPTAGDRIDRDETAESIFVLGGGDTADEEGIVLRIVAGAACRGRGVELDAGDIFKGIADIEGADVAHERGGEDLDVHRQILDRGAVTGAGGGVGGTVFVVIFGDDLEDIELDDFLVGGRGASGRGGRGGGDLRPERGRGGEQCGDGKRREGKTRARVVHGVGWAE